MVLPVSAISIAAGVSNIIAMLRIFVAKQLRIIDWPPSLVMFPIRQKLAGSSTEGKSSSDGRYAFIPPDPLGVPGGVVFTTGRIGKIDSVCNPKLLISKLGRQ
jgi:hypothetical protein